MQVFDLGPAADHRVAPTAGGRNDPSNTSEQRLVDSVAVDDHRTSDNNDEQAVIVRSRHKVAPLINVTRPVVLVPQPHVTSRRRTPVFLTTDTDFDGEGMFTCSDDKVLFYRDANATEPIATPATFSGAELTTQVVLFAEAWLPSDSKDDIELRLSLSGGRKSIEPDAVREITAVLLRFDLYSDPREMSGSVVMTPPLKIDPGRLLPVQDVDWQRDLAVDVDNPVYGGHELPSHGWGHPRTRIVVHRALPHDYDGQFHLRAEGGAVTLHHLPTVEEQGSINFPMAFRNPDMNGEVTKFLDGAHGGSASLELTIGGVVGDVAHVHVVGATFSESAGNTNYGYDDMDGEPGHIEHISVKSGGSTGVHLDLAGPSRTKSSSRAKTPTRPLSTSDRFRRAWTLVSTARRATTRSTP